MVLKGADDSLYAKCVLDCFRLRFRPDEGGDVERVCLRVGKDSLEAAAPNVSCVCGTMARISSTRDVAAF